MESRMVLSGSEKNGKKYKRQACLWGLAKVTFFQKSEFTMEVGGWVQISRNYF